MKKIALLIFVLSVCQLISYGQEDVSLDQMLVNVNKSSVTSGIIYERSATFANLYTYNSLFDTATFQYFEQAEYELYDASNQTKFISNDALRSLYVPKSQASVVDIGILNSQYQILNYDSIHPSNGGLTLSNNLFYQISGKPPFLSSAVTVIAPLKESIVGTSFTYNFKSNLLFTNGTKTIKTVSADLGDGVSRNVIVNGAIAISSATVTYSSSGYKYLKFTVTFSDNSTHVTYGKIYAKVLSAMAPSYVGEITDDFTLTASIPFQGYDETAPTYAQIQYRIFYKINNGNTQKTLTKPVIISDGFDPGDLRKIEAKDYTVPYDPTINTSIEDMVKYKDCNDSTQNLIQVLNQKGYDVVIVNYPTYTSTTTGKEINGGADFIERNAMAMVALIQKLNTTLAANGSSQQLVAVGPSMGGQITRYALAYMEKQYAATGDTKWLHKTRLWISIDSPHLGANIPEGLQALINLLKSSSPDATDYYNKRLGSPAAKQQLINWHQEAPLQGGGTSYYGVNTTDLNGRTISQGWPTNSGSSFYQQFYNNEFNNGLPNSKGYPMNLRKIAMVNGSVTGKTYGTDGQLTLDIKAYTSICILGPCWTVNAATFQTFTMPAYSTDHNIAFFRKFLKQRHTHAPNNDSRGNVDILPGGSYPGYDILNESIVGKSLARIYAVGFPFYLGTDPKKFFYDQRANAGTHCFIPTFSALGMKNPNQNWAQSLKRNLVCSNEIPFDSYFGHDDNTKHTSFDCESVNWLLKELDGTLQAPWFPMSETDLSGSTTLCLNATSTYNFSALCNIPSAVTWSVSSNMQVVSSTSTSINLKGLTTGAGKITATFTNGETVVKNITVGVPPVTLIRPARVGTTCYYDAAVNLTAPNTSIEFSTDNSNWTGGTLSGGVYYAGYDFVGPSTQLVYARTRNSCGVSAVKSNNLTIPAPPGNCNFIATGRSAQGINSLENKEQYTNKISVFPNPTKDDVTISLNNTSSKFSTPSKMYVIKVISPLGIIQKTLNYKTGVTSVKISLSGLTSGMYFISIFDGQKWNNRSLMIQK